VEIVHIASEFAPFAKVGGLGDAVAGLTGALVEKGHSVEVFLPKYDIIDTSILENLRKVDTLLLFEQDEQITTTLWQASFRGVSLTLVDPDPYFKEGKIYGNSDDTKAFLFFCKVVAKALSQREKSPDIFHAHDWMTGAALLFLEKPHEPKTLFTIHNLKYQGKCAPSYLEHLRLAYDEEVLSDPVNSEDLNLLKGGITFSDQTTAVSPSYAEEILSPDGGFGLEQFLTQNKTKITGVLNGIDTTYWDPNTDPSLISTYSAEAPLPGKLANKRYIQKTLGLTPSDTSPLVVSITRLVPQKGPDLIEYGIEKCAEIGGQFVLLGSCSDPETEKQFTELKRRFERDPHIAIHLGYDEKLSHLLFAASDMFFMPSLFEPCGLTQMIAMRYGSIPLAHATGGLKDTIFDPETSKEPNGFLFRVPDNKGVSSVLERAFSLFAEKESWNQLMLRGMEADLSWNASASKYLKLYKSK